MWWEEPGDDASPSPSSFLCNVSYSCVPLSSPTPPHRPPPPAAPECEASVLSRVLCSPGPLALHFCHCPEIFPPSIELCSFLPPHSPAVTSVVLPLKSWKTCTWADLTRGKERMWAQPNNFCPGGFRCHEGKKNQRINILNQTTLNFVRCFILFALCTPNQLQTQSK